MKKSITFWVISSIQQTFNSPKSSSNNKLVWWFCNGFSRYVIWITTCSCGRYTLPAKMWKIWNAQWEHSYLTFWFAVNGLPTTTDKYCDFNAIVTYSVMDKSCNLLRAIHNRLYRNVSFLSTLPKRPNNFQGIHHCIRNLWNFFVHSIIHYWYHAKFTTCSRMTIWARK